MTTFDGVPLAGYGRRLVARIVDRVLILLLTLLVTSPGVVWVGNRYADEKESLPPGITQVSRDLENQVALMVLGWFAVSVLFDALYAIFFLPFAGATPGKMLVGIRVRRSLQDARPSVGRSLARWVTTDVPIAILCVYPLADAIVGLFQERRQCVHDLAADTVVVRSR